MISGVSLCNGVSFNHPSVRPRVIAEREKVGGAEIKVDSASSIHRRELAWLSALNARRRGRVFTEHRGNHNLENTRAPRRGVSRRKSLSADRSYGLAKECERSPVALVKFT